MVVCLPGLIGAVEDLGNVWRLVGGPDRLDGYKDNRKEYKQTEVTIDYNAGFTGATAGLLYYIELNYISGL